MMKRDEKLAANGWEKRFIACEPRLSEMVNLYNEIGFEVHLEPLSPREEMDTENCEINGCTVCFDRDRDRFKIIFTKPAVT